MQGRWQRKAHQCQSPGHRKLLSWTYQRSHKSNGHNDMVKALQWLRNSYSYYQRVRFFVHQLTNTTKVLYQCQSCEAFLIGLLFFKVSSQYQTGTLGLCSQKDEWMPFSDLFHFTRGMICQQLSICFALSLVRYPPTVGPMMKASVAEASRKTMKRGKRSDGTTSAKYACRCAGTSSWHPKRNGNMRRSQPQSRTPNKHHLPKLLFITSDAFCLEDGIATGKEAGEATHG